MLLHLPIAILVTLSPIAVSDTLPTFDVVKECRDEGGPAANVDRCSRDEAAALEQLKNEWTRFVGADKRTCTKEAMIDDSASYVELLTCLEMANGAGKEDSNPPDPGTGTSSPPRQAAQPGATVGIGHDSIRFEDQALDRRAAGGRGMTGSR